MYYTARYSCSGSKSVVSSIHKKKEIVTLGGVGLAQWAGGLRAGGCVGACLAASLFGRSK